MKTAPDGVDQQEEWRIAGLAAVEFDIVLTSNRNLSHQQNLSVFDIAVIVLVAASNRIDDLRSLAPRVLEVLGKTAQAGTVTLSA